VHQIVDYPRVLDDPLALPIVQADAWLQTAIDRQSRGMRASIVMRSRYAEDRLVAAVARGVTQYVVLGAGLDTYAYRNPFAHAGLKVFEVDHPATQRWKRERLDSIGVQVPHPLTFVPIDFETQRLPDQLARAGFRSYRPAFFSLLGVVIYLSKPAAMETMRVVAACAPQSEVVFSFSVPDSMLSEPQRAARSRSMAQVAAAGEPWLSFFEPEALAAELRTLGFGTTELFSSDDANRAYFAARSDGLRMIGPGYMMAATV
jgi:methyltransferase (TIGR00027 family)